MKIKGTKKNDVILGTKDSDFVAGRAGNDHIAGFDGDDLIRGNRGNDNIDGGGGRNILYGGKGDDTFIFFRFDEIQSFSKIKDFTVGEDVLRIDTRPDDLGSNNIQFDFILGGKNRAGDGLSVMYNENNGKLWLDVDGKDNPANAVLLGKTGKHLELSAGDIIVV